MEKLSVVIIAGNEEKNIRDCLESVKWADEIILIDSESNDNTREIAKEYTPHIYLKKWEGFVAQRKFSIEKTSYDWVLSIDADERVEEKLMLEIKELLNSNNKKNGYWIPRQNYFLGKVIKTCGWYPDYQMRFFNKNFVRLSDRKVHEGFEVDGKTGRLNNHLIHFTHQNITNTIKKINDYSYLQALEKKDGKRVKTINLILNPAAAFLNHFIGRKGYKDGIHGLMVSLIHMMTNLLTYMKTWELQNKMKVGDETKNTIG